MFDYFLFNWNKKIIINNLIRIYKIIQLIKIINKKKLIISINYY